MASKPLERKVLMRRLMAPRIENGKVVAPMIVLKDGWDIPIHDFFHTKYAVDLFWLYKFPSRTSKRHAAEKVCTAAVRFGMAKEDGE